MNYQCFAIADDEHFLDSVDDEEIKTFASENKNAWLLFMMIKFQLAC